MSLTNQEYGDPVSSPLNNSRSKLTYSFSKATRFKAPAKSQCNVICYELPPTKSKRAPSFGYGSRHRIIRKEQSPPPGAYNPTESLKRISKSKAFTFGISREAYKKVYVNNSSCIDFSLPGPGTYPTTEYIGREGQRSTLKPKLPLSFLQVREKSPGPCAYSALSGIHPQGKYASSKHKNSLAKVFDPVRSKRFSSVVKNACPGPGAYGSFNGITGQGDYYLSTMQSTHVIRFLKGNRNNTVAAPSRVQTPGPGSYRIPSDFGYIEDRPSFKKFANKTIVWGKQFQKREERPQTKNSKLGESQSLAGIQSLPHFKNLPEKTQL